MYIHLNLLFCCALNLVSSFFLCYVPYVTSPVLRRLVVLAYAIFVASKVEELMLLLRYYAFNYY